MQLSFEAKLAGSLVRTKFWHRISVEDWSKLRAPEKAQLIRGVVAELTELEPTRRGVQALVAALNQTNKRFQGENGTEVFHSCGQLYLQGPRQRRALAEIGWQSRAKRYTCRELGLTVSVEGQKFAQAQVRFARAGDRYRGKKLKRIFLAQRVPRPERSLCPVIAAPQSDEVLWYFPQDAKPVVACEFPFSSLIKVD